MECFNADRFVPVSGEREMEDVAFDLNDKKLFFGGILFDNITDDVNEVKNFSYTIRMDVDNTPITLENKNRFWFPGPLASFAMDMRYHRGFIQLQHSVDQGIIKTVKKARFNAVAAEAKETAEDGHDAKPTTTAAPKSVEVTVHRQTTTTMATPDATTTEKPSPLLDLLYHEIANGDGSPVNVTGTAEDLEGAGLEDFLNFNDETTTGAPSTTAVPQQHNGTVDDHLVAKNRTKRSPQFGGFLDMLMGTAKPKKPKIKYNVEDLSYYTKQFPYPAYKKDTFKVGIYLSQAVQMAFFFGLIVQIGSAVRNRIWIRESGNYMVSKTLC